MRGEQMALAALVLVMLVEIIKNNEGVEAVAHCKSVFDARSPARLEDLSRVISNTLGRDKFMAFNEAVTICGYAAVAQMCGVAVWKVKMFIIKWFEFVAFDRCFRKERGLLLERMLMVLNRAQKKLEKGTRLPEIELRESLDLMGLLQQTSRVPLGSDLEGNLKDTEEFCKQSLCALTKVDERRGSASMAHVQAGYSLFKDMLPVLETPIPRDIRGWMWDHSWPLLRQQLND